jgi:hypothetical protein
MRISEEEEGRLMGNPTDGQHGPSLEQLMAEMKDLEGHALRLSEQAATPLEQKCLQGMAVAFRFVAEIAKGGAGSVQEHMSMLPHMARYLAVEGPQAERQAIRPKTPPVQTRPEHAAREQSLQGESETVESGRKPTPEERSCSFCGKGERAVKKLVPGPGVAICGECLAFAKQVLEQGGGPRPS